MDLGIVLKDGCRRSARVWMPEGEGPFPAVLEFLPYRRRDGTAARDALTARPAAARLRQADPAWQADYRAPRPKVERKIGHLMRRRHGGRRARVRGLAKVAADFALLAAAVSLARLGVLGVAYRNGAWAAAGR